MSAYVLDGEGRSARARRALSAGLVLIAALAGIAVFPAASHAAPCDAPVTNPIACENTLPGTPSSVWQIDGAGDQSIQGYATQMSVNRGATIDFKIKSATSNYKINVYRLGYYGGDGARLVASNLTPTGTSTQPSCLTQASTGLIDCGNWAVSRSWAVPSTAVSGVYIAHLIRNDTGGASHITFVVRDDASTSDIVVQTSDASWQAYNTWGGNSTYTCATICPSGDPLGYKSAYKVSYNRPFRSAEDDIGGRSFLWWSEYPMIRFLEASGYNASYLSQIDTQTRGPLLKNHKLFISSGHDEYWSQAQRTNVESARDAGVNLAFFSGNEVFWKTRYEPSIATGAAADRTLVTYKDTHFASQVDPVEWTGTWRDPRYTTPPNRPVPENALTGQSFLVNAGTSDIMVPSEYKNLRMWRNTAAASLSAGQSLRLAPGTLGFEWDEDADNGFRPPGQFRLSSTTVSGVEKFLDYGSTVALGTATHNLTTHRVASGALVFGAGTVQWSWGLDNTNPFNNPPDQNMRQATVNLFADMGVQPAALLPGLVAATKSTDLIKPTSSLTSPPSAVNDGARVTLSGTASDGGGGTVAGVEVSTDGGTTWHPATGTTNWSYAWIAHGAPSTTIKTRAVDDTGNLQVPGAGAVVAVNCPCSIWGANVTPAVADAGDPGAIEVGVKFKADVYGAISGVRFYKAAANTGTHTGSLWTTTGTRLAQATFTSESASGWQTVSFETPVQVEPGTTYVASYFAPNGRYSGTPAYLYPDPAPGPNGGGSADAAPLHALRNTGTTTNGVYTYNPTSTFPTSTFAATNYWVDVVFAPTPAPGQVTGAAATSAGRTAATVTWSAPAGGGTPATYRITPFVGTSAQPATTVTAPLTSARVGGLTQGTAYTFTVQAVNPTGSGPPSDPTNAVTPLNPVAPSAPSAVLARPASQSALVSWSAPSSDGDSPITGHTITPYIGATAQPPVQTSGAATSATVPGLSNGTAYTFRVTATNAVGGSPQSAASAAATPQNTIFDFSAPAVADSGDGNPVELGVKWTADVSGSVTGLRFYKAAANTGTHTGSLWTASGTRLAQATFTNESATGWQTVTFATPVSVTAGTTYVASYHAPAGRYSVSGGQFAAGAVDNAPLRALANATSANGVFAYSGSSTFPSGSYNGGNYWVDVLFSVPAPGQALNAAATAAGSTSATVSWTAPASGGPASSYRITPFVGAIPQASKTVTGSPLPTSANVTGLTQGTTYTFTVTAVNGSGAGGASAPSNAVTPLNPVAPTAPTAVLARPASKQVLVTWSVPSGDGDSPITGYTITPYIGGTAQSSVTAGASASSAVIPGLTNGTGYGFRVSATNAIGSSPQSPPSAAVTPQDTIFDFSAPGNPDSGDSNAVELGVKFRSDQSGSITGIRFYKAAANTGTHSGSLWTTGGTRLAQATFTNESTSGWQVATFATPVAVTAGTTYVASYFAPNGRYSASSGTFASAGVDNPPLRALSNATSGNGVYSYSASSTFPSSTYNAGNYWVDAMFALATPGQVGAPVATAGKASATVSWNTPGGGPPASYRVMPYIGTTAQPGLAKTVSGSPPATSTTITGLSNGTSYTFTATATNTSGSGTESSRSNAVTPLAATAPDPPTGVAAAGDSRSATVRWTAPASDGGSPLTGYVVTPYAGATAGTPLVVAASTTSTRVAGLTNDTSYTFRVQARNTTGDSAESAASGAVTPRRSIFELTTPAVIDAGDTSSIEVGVKFRSDLDGSITGVRFYKATANTGTHTGSLWSAGGTRLAQVTFTDESASGWQTATFSAPVAITAGTTYVASYFAPVGRFSTSSGAFGSGPVDTPPLHALADATSPNGVFAYSAATGFPTGSFNAANYWVDVLFAPAAAPGQVPTPTATAGATSATVDWSAPTSGGAPSSYEVVPYIGSSAQTTKTKTVTGSPPETITTLTGLTAGTSYTFTVTAISPNGRGPASSQSNAVTAADPVVPGAPTDTTATADATSAIVRWTAPASDGASGLTSYTVTPYVGTAAQPSTQVGATETTARVLGLTNGTGYRFTVRATNGSGTGPESSASSTVTPRDSLFDLSAPAVADAGDTSAVTVGVKFTSDVSGTVTGLRFYKSATNTGTHVGGLWAADGTLLAQATFVGESASGWQVATLSAPVAIASDTTYVAGYLAPQGRYSVTGAQFGSGVFANPPLRALANATTANGVYTYGSTLTFPTNSFNATNYWADILFGAGL